jgi:hypothetical protein
LAAIRLRYDRVRLGRSVRSRVALTAADALEAASARRGRSIESTAVLAAEAGTDLLLFTGDKTETAAVYERLLERARDDTIPLGSLERSYSRIIALKG